MPQEYRTQAEEGVRLLLGEEPRRAREGGVSTSEGRWTKPLQAHSPTLRRGERERLRPRPGAFARWLRGGRP